MTDYYVTYRIDGRLTVHVSADSPEEAKEKAYSKYMDANMNDADIIESDIVTVEDSDGNIVFEA